MATEATATATAGGSGLSPEDEAARFKTWMEEGTSRMEDAAWCAVAAPWLDSVQEYWSGKAGRPAAIDNSTIVDSEGNLKQGLKPGTDFVGVQEHVWTALAKWFGAGTRLDGVVRVDGPPFRAWVEWYPVPTQAFPCDPASGKPLKEQAVTLPFGRSTPVAIAHTALCRQFQAKTRLSRVWVLLNDNGTAVWTRAPTGDDATLNDSGAGVMKAVMLETCGKPGAWVRDDAATAATVVETSAGEDKDAPKQETIEEFRMGLKKGDKLDARDKYGDWFESYVKDVSKTGEKLVVHFRSWQEKYDSRIQRKDIRIQRPYTMTTDWRATLEVGSSVELHTNNGSKPWRVAKILEMDVGGVKGQVRVKSEREGDPVMVCDIEDERLAELGVHLAKNHTRKNGDQALLDAQQAAAGAVRTAYDSRYGTGGYGSRGDIDGRPAAVGVVGLRNLRNTCYMNAVLQCLCNSSALANFFLTGEYQKDINKENFMGCNGELAKRYAELVTKAWSNKYRILKPEELKKFIGEKNEEFRGYQQHDAHNLLQWLLDNLLEDLCTVKKKQTGQVEEKGKTARQIADEAWDLDMGRKRSIITQLFYGQTKEVRRCNVCHDVTSHFQSMLNVEVRVSLQSLRKCMVLYYDYEPGKCAVRYDAIVDDGANFAEVKEWCFKELGFKPDEMVFCLTRNGEFAQWCFDTTTVGIVDHSSYIMCYKVPQLPPLEGAGDAAGADDAGVGGGAGAGTESDSKGDAADAGGGAGAGAGAKDDDGEKETGIGAVLQTMTANCEGVAIVYMRYAEVSTDYYGRRTKERTKPLPDPALLSLYALSGKRGQMPTHNQVLEAILAKTRRILKKGEKVTLDDNRFSVGVMPLDAYLTKMEPMPRDDEPIEIDPKTQAIIIDFDAKQFEGWNKNASREVDKTHPSFTAKLPEEPAEVDLVKDRLQKATEFVQLSGSNQVYCEKCSDLRRAYIGTRYMRLPEFMCIHLGRFRIIGEIHTQTIKLDTLVHFPLQGLDMRPYMDPSSPSLTDPHEPAPIYDLYGVVNHFGSLYGGHYTCMVRSSANGKWYDISDDHVVEMSSTKAIVTKRAYLLFYKRRPRGTPAPPMPEPVEETAADADAAAAAAATATAEADATDETPATDAPPAPTVGGGAGGDAGAAAPPLP